MHFSSFYILHNPIAYVKEQVPSSHSLDEAATFVLVALISWLKGGRGKVQILVVSTLENAQKYMKSSSYTMYMYSTVLPAH